jgi:hypothetical protein
MCLSASLFSGLDQLASPLAHRLLFNFVDFAWSVLVSGEDAIALIALPILWTFLQVHGSIILWVCLPLIL